jgi:uncharacterized membrane-anchored protein
MASARFPTAHPWRERLVRELHARPSEPISAPASVSRLVMAVGEGGADEARAYLSRLCTRRGVAEPPVTASFHAADLGNARLRWERHTELVTYQVVCPLDPSRAPFAHLAPDGLPDDWLAGIPGQLLIGMHAEVRDHAGGLDDLARITFGQDGYAASSAADGAVWLASDFRMHGDGFERLIVAAAPGASALVVGRLLQALFEINTYRMAALLGFPTALETRGKLAALEGELAATMARFEASADHAADRDVLDRLTSLSAQAEALANATNYRFAASGAYHRLVGERIEALGERSVPDRPTLGAFIARRLAPAMRTCDAVLARQEALLERIARATRLLATRVQVATEEQNAKVLDSMNTRARAQLRLQQTVEGLSVVALSYYVLGILGYVFKGMHEGGWGPDPSVAVALAALPTIGAVWWFLQRVKERLGVD